VFLAIFQVLQFVFLIFYDFQFSCHTPGPTECISHISPVRVYLAIYRSHSVFVSFSTFFCFLTILQVLQCAFFFFHVFIVSQHIPGHKVFVSHFPYFSVFRHNTGPTVCITHFHGFQCFSPYCTCYNRCFSLSLIFSFLAIYRILQCSFLIFNVFSCFLPYSTSYSVCFAFSMIFSFLVILQVL
jgi:hypothetical protein